MQPLDPDRYLLRGHPRLRARPADLVRGQDFLDHLLPFIAAARKSVYVEFYILRSDGAGYDLAEALITAVSRGVRVCLIYDAFGSVTDSESIIGYLTDGGVEVLKYHPLTRYWIWPRGTFGRRNHRKQVIVDGEVAFVGSGNVGDEYRNDFADSFYDVSVELRGPVVAGLASEFARVWNRFVTKPVYVRQPNDPRPAPVGQVLANREFRRRRVIERAYLHALSQARSSILIMNAYFVPNRRVRRALYAAAARGVDVRLIVPCETNHHVVHLAGSFFFARLLRRGVRIFRWTDQILHAKCAVVDETWTLIGSYNFDALSLRRNLEIAVTISDTDFGQRALAELRQDFDRCEELTRAHWDRRPLFQRIKEWLAHKLRNWL